MRRFCCCILTIVLLCFCASDTAYAWKTSQSFICDVKKDNIPNKTKYIDMLIPIAENDKYYVLCNSDNCKLFNIPENSEIVSYNDGGYKSYTFHVCDAYSLMRPEVVYYFEISKEDYNAHKEFLKPYDDRREPHWDAEKNEWAYISDGGFIRYTIPVYMESIEYTNFWKLFSQVKLHNFSQTEARVEFNTEFFIKDHNFCYEKRSVECDYDYCRSTYKTVKFAYIDESGHILGVSNAVRVYKNSIADPQPWMQLSGLTLTNHFQYGPPFWIFQPLLLGIAALSCLCIIILIKVINVRKKKKFRCPS